jgi:hypothetical protein
MDKDFFKYKLKKYKDKYDNLKSLIINEHPPKILDIKYISLISSEDYYKDESISSYYNPDQIILKKYQNKYMQFFQNKPNIDKDLINEIIRINLEDLKDIMDIEQDNILIEEDFFNEKLFKQYIKLAKENNYKIIIRVPKKNKNSKELINYNIINRIIDGYK